MIIKRRNFLKASAALGAGALAGFPHIWIKDYSLARAAGGEIKVGVLFSLTGTTAIIEESLNKATIMAIEEINAAGGINGMQIAPIVEDPASDPATFAEKARKLVVGDKCVSVFGSYTSASRKAVLPVFEKRNNLYFYPTLYEGRECSKNVIYTGAVPNQQQDEFVPWLVEKFGKKFFLIGSNYIYPKEENNYCKKLLEKLGGEVVNEEYVPLGHSEFSSVINKIKSTEPNVIFSTVVGDSVVALHRQYRAAGLDPAKDADGKSYNFRKRGCGHGRRSCSWPLHVSSLLHGPQIAGEREVRCRLQKTLGRRQSHPFRFRAVLFPDVSLQAGDRKASRKRYFT